MTVGAHAREAVSRVAPVKAHENLVRETSPYGFTGKKDSEKLAH